MPDFLWWRDGVIYQIYPRSFADSNGNGLGDLPGITAHLDYLSDLGIDAIWLSPFYPTPDADFGYDLSDHTDVDPRFGTMGDFDNLLAEAHQRNIRIVLDLVLNHTSDQHPWFLESRSSRKNSKSDWYIWQDHIPNNWQSVFGGRAWTYAPEREQYFYHMFLTEQPDLNWHNPEVRQAQLDVVRFWLERGVDGFRLDVFNVYFKDAMLRNNPKKLGLRPFDQQQHVYDADRPEMIALLNELRSMMDSYTERYAVGETFIASPEKAAWYSGPGKLHAAFNFDFTFRRYDPSQFLEAIQKWDRFASGEIWPNYVLSNHDIVRSASRYAKGEDDARAKIVLAMLLTLRGTPFLYYGEELGMRDISLKRSEILDPPGKRYWPLYKGRDACRSPMQWDDSPHAGFSTVKPWLPVHPNYAKRNVAAQLKQPDSILNFTHRLISLRKEYPALQHGAITALTPNPRKVLAYLRKTHEQTILVVLNFSGSKESLDSVIQNSSWNLLLSSNPTIGNARSSLEPHEARILFEET
jgi:alpha-glucosidase